MRRFLILSLFVAVAATAARAEKLEVGQTGTDFEVTTPGGKKVTLKGLLEAEGTKAVVVEFGGLGCPFTMGARPARHEVRRSTRRPTPKGDHSRRNATVGSSRAARSAGTIVATNATPSSSSVIPTKVDGSQGRIP